jgi:NitT/TauT family transport system permease protein
VDRVATRPAWSRPVGVGLPALVFVAAAAAWWLGTIASGVPETVVPTPWDVGQAFAAAPEHLLHQTGVTTAETLIGFAVATIAGLVIAITLAASSTVERAVMPLLVALHTVPKVSLAPLLVIWLGFGPEPKIAMVALISFFPIMLSTTTGLTATPTELAELAASLSASRWQTFVKVRFPWALPQIFTGLKVAITLAVIGAVVAEIANPNSGLGAVIVTAGASADTARAFAAIILLAAVSTALFYGLVGIERLLLRWARDTTGVAADGG